MTQTSSPLQLQFSPPRRGKPPRHFADLTGAERQAALAELGEKPFRAKQLATHYFTHLTCDPAAMTDLPVAGRDGLVEHFFPPLLTAARAMRADGGTTCPFCATGQLGLTRNLSTAEIIEQVRFAARALADGELPGGPTRLSNLVFMGMGEPLANYRAVIETLRLLVAPTPDGLGMSARNITVSTVGLVPAMDKLAKEGIPVTLALSLHAPDEKLRSELVPINTRWSAAEALDSAHRYFEATGRRVSIEYALIRDMNDHAWRADLLAEELVKRGRGWVHVNPIPLNPTPGSKWTASEPAVEAAFVARLRAHGIPTTIRDTRGRDIDGACGQLAAEEDE